MKYDTVYTEDGMIKLPDVELKQLPSGCKEVFLRGYEYIVAVVDSSGEYQGWKAKSNPIP